MPFSIRAIIGAFQNVHAGISGINTAGTILPSAIDTEDCPLVMTIPGEGLLTDNADLLWQRQRIYNVYVYVQPLIQDMTHEGITQTMELMDEFEDVYEGNPNLGGTVFETRRVADSGYAQLEYNGVRYHGFTYFVTVDQRC